MWSLAWSTGWVKSSDTGQAADLARTEDEAANIVEMIDRQGAVATEPIVSPRGEVVGERWGAHSLAAELRKLDTQLLALRRSLRVDPGSRARLAVEAYDDRPDWLDEQGECRRERIAAARAS